MSAPPPKNDGQTGAWSRYSDLKRWGLLSVLLSVSVLNVVDRVIVSVLLDPIKHEFHLSDTMLGLLSGLAFGFFYALASLPFARWADSGNRRTVITVALAAWSCMTMLCGLSRSLWQLVVARVAVGVAESGSGTPTQSLIADYFAPAQRPAAIGFLNATGNLGYLLGVGLGGYVAASHGWRAAFLCAGAPGLIMAVAVRFFIDEPRSNPDGRAALRQPESTLETLSALFQNRPLIWAVSGIALYAFYGYGASMFVPSFMVRELGYSLETVSTRFAVAISIATATGAVVGGWLISQLIKRDVRWHAWLPALGCLISVPIYGCTLTARELSWSIGGLCAAEAVLASTFPAVYAGIHLICGDTRRATAFSLVLLATTFVGLGLGPLSVGVLSDALAASWPHHSLQYALTLMLASLIAAALAFMAFGRTLRLNLARP